MTFRLVLAAHLACAFGAAALFWIPLTAAKGGPLHIRAGRLYARLIYLTAITGVPLTVLMIASASDQAGQAGQATLRTAAFLAYLLTILVMPVYHGVRVVRARDGGLPVGSALHTALALSAIAGGLMLGAAAVAWREWPFVLMSPIGPVLGTRALVYSRRSRRDLGARGTAWREEHIVFMVMSGIAVHTAMLVFGTTRTLEMTFTGAAVYLPWLLPTLIGFPLLVLRVRRERRALR